MVTLLSLRYNYYPMEPQKPKTSAKDFFIHLASMVALYWATGSLIALLYTVIDAVHPPIYYGGSGSIAWPVASLIVIFPLFILFSWLLQKDYAASPEKMQLGVRKWLTYITLFVSGAILAGSLISVIYKFLDGQELTTGFLLKVLSWLVVAGLVFGYYLQTIRDKVGASQRKSWLILAVVLVLGSIVAGFSIIGSPKTQRLTNYDNQKVSDLLNIQSQVVQYWQQKQTLPENLDALRDPLSSVYGIPMDPQSGASYTYKKTAAMSFEICADFNLESTPQGEKVRMSNAMYYVGVGNENWMHGVGNHCFERTVDPQRYPPFNKGL
jgi:hypothetical protein